MSFIKKSVVGVVMLGLTACAADDPNRRAKTGAAVGAIAGAVIGKQVSGGPKGAVTGAIIGGIAGGATGNYMDKQQQEFEAALAQEQSQHALEIQRMADESLKIDVSNEISFDFNSANVKNAFMPTLDKVANVLNRYPQTNVTVVGHTDSTGSEAYNQQLSERRARNVADYMVGRGVDSGRMFSIGQGESQPRASNDTEAGRQLNRRVEILVKPITQ